MPDLLVEIGVEEIPADVVLPALEQLKTLLHEGLAEVRLEHGEIITCGTPRRLAVMVHDVADKQQELVQEVKGPAAQAAFDAEGNPTKAAEGFARGRGIDVSELAVRETDKGSFVFATVRESGQPANEVLPGLIVEAITALAFPKTMRWADLEARFARPVRWLVALLGSDVLDVEFAQVRADRFSRGHRFLGAQRVEITSPAEYREILRREYVIADHEERRDIIAQGARQAAEAVGGRPRLDEDLLDENNFLVEYPTCIIGGFDEKYLAIPEAVLVTVMQKHQRYFPVEDEQGQLLPKFIIIRNGDANGAEIVSSGNEKVIVPRLDDAAFYLEEDTRIPLAERLESLGRVTYMESLGTLLDKTRRIEAWVQWLADYMEPALSPGQRTEVLRAAELSKCDQVTLMVGDSKLAALQGIIGGHYARLSGETETVATALAEQYLPARQDDPLPQSAAGRLLAMADRFDNLCAAFSLGMIPSGARDPQGLRRQVQGILAIALDARLQFPLAEALDFGMQLLPPMTDPPKGALDKDAAAAALLEFFCGRITGLLEEEGIAYDTVRAAVGSRWSEMGDVVLRARMLHEIRASEPGFAALVDTATRPANIWRNADLPDEAAVDEQLFEDDTERKLWQALQQVRQELDRVKSSEPVDYRSVWNVLCELEAPIARLLDTVMVNAEDMCVRTNRLAMMRELDHLYGEMADFTEIVQ